MAAAIAAPSAAGAYTPVQIATTSLPDATVGQPYSAQIEVTGGTPPYRVGLSDVQGYPLPPGLSMDASGLISGTAGAPPVPQPTTYTAIYAVTDAVDDTVSADLPITLRVPGYLPPPPLKITTSSIPLATYNQPYSFAFAATGGTGRDTWTADGLPQGFTMSDQGVISGQNLLPEQATITVTVTDSGTVYTNLYGVQSSSQQTVSQQYTFTVTSGYPQLDPTLFQLSTMLVQSYDLSFDVLYLIEALPSSSASEYDKIVGQLEYLLCQLTSVNGGKGCLVSGLPLVPIL